MKNNNWNLVKAICMAVLAIMAMVIIITASTVYDGITYGALMLGWLFGAAYYVQEYISLRHGSLPAPEEKHGLLIPTLGYLHQFFLDLWGILFFGFIFYELNNSALFLRVLGFITVFSVGAVLVGNTIYFIRLVKTAATTRANIAQPAASGTAVYKLEADNGKPFSVFSPCVVDAETMEVTIPPDEDPARMDYMQRATKEALDGDEEYNEYVIISDQRYPLISEADRKALGDSGKNFYWYKENPFFTAEGEG